jgi:hypothetical protein
MRIHRALLAPAFFTAVGTEHRIQLKGHMGKRGVRCSMVYMRLHGMGIHRTLLAPPTGAAVGMEHGTQPGTRVCRGRSTWLKFARHSGCLH